MIWLPGILSQGGEKFVWNRYAISYGEKAGTAATVQRTYNKSKYASTAYTIQNGVFALTNPVATTFENLTSGKCTVDMADSTNALSSGATLYKVLRNTRLWEVSAKNYSLTTSYFAVSSTDKLCTSYVLDSEGIFVLSLATPSNVDFAEGLKLYAISSFGITVNTSASTMRVQGPIYQYELQSYEYDGQWMLSTNYIAVELTSQTTKNEINFASYDVAAGPGDLIDTVIDRDPAAYPENGMQDGYWYVLQTA